MPFLVSCVSFFACILLGNELAGAIAFASAAMRALATARRSGEEIQKSRKATFDGVVELFHGDNIAQTSPAAKGKTYLVSICNMQESRAIL